MKAAVLECADAGHVRGLRSLKSTLRPEAVRLCKNTLSTCFLHGNSRTDNVDAALYRLISRASGKKKSDFTCHPVENEDVHRAIEKVCPLAVVRSVPCGLAL